MLIVKSSRHFSVAEKEIGARFSTFKFEDYGSIWAVEWLKHIPNACGITDLGLVGDLC